MLLITDVADHLCSLQQACRYGCAHADDLDVALPVLHSPQLVLLMLAVHRARLSGVVSIVRNVGIPIHDIMCGLLQLRHKAVVSC
jgi:hypothetical protein